MLANPFDRAPDLKIEDLVVAPGMTRVAVYLNGEFLYSFDAVLVFHDGFFQRCLDFVLPDIDIGGHDKINFPYFAAVGEVVTKLIQLGAQDQGNVLNNGLLYGAG